STHRAVPAMHAELGEAWRRARAEGGRIAYLEGPDQHRGWFNSSLMVSVGADRRAPYTDVFTHGWVLDQQGRAMHKSLGNVIAPLDIVKKNGAEIVRWWALATDWRADVRVGDEILQRVSEAYRKVRNTFRFLLGNLSDFDPGEHALPLERQLAVDRAFGNALDERVRDIRAAYERMEFHRALDAVLNFCTVDLSAVFLDVTKDRLYTLAAGHPARRSAQSALWRALHDLCVASSPLIVFTSEEVWQSHPSLMAERESVHLADWPAAAAGGAGGEEWRRLLALRESVNAALEPMRAAKTLGSTTEASVRVSASASDLSRLERYRDELPGFLLVAELAIEPEARAEASTATFRVEAAPADAARFKKCERCWMHRTDVSAEGLCGRCREALASDVTAGTAG
ncbi:MAG: class I tRNA ligase family protein, partial [Candidatus Eiseniibacteriota bacterium]